MQDTYKTIKGKDYIKYYDSCLEFLLNAPYAITKLLHFLELKKCNNSKLITADLKSIMLFSKIKSEDLSIYLRQLSEKNILFYSVEYNAFYFNYAFLNLKIKSPSFLIGSKSYFFSSFI